MTLYIGNGCPKCNVAKSKASEKVELRMAEDFSKKFVEHNISTIPVLELDDGTWVTNFTDIMNYLRGEN